MTNTPGMMGMMGRDESMPNRASDPDLSSEKRDEARRIATQTLEDASRNNSDYESVAMARAVLRYVPAGVPAPAPHPVAAADDKTRPAPLPGHAIDVLTEPGLTGVAYTGSPALDFLPPVITGPGLPAPGVICEPIEDDSSGVCEASDDSSTTQHRPGKASPTLFIDLNDQTRR